jgi:hypothetical protein
MTVIGRRATIWFALALTPTLLAGYVLLYALSTSVLEPTALDGFEDSLTSLGLIAYSTLGIMIVRRHPRQAVGWLFCAIGLTDVLEHLSGTYAIYALLVQPGLLPGGLAAAWLQNWIWAVWSVLLVAFLPLLFPTGRVLSPRWRLAVWANAVALALLVVGGAFHTGPLDNRSLLAYLQNPLGIAPFGSDMFAEVGGLFGVVDRAGYGLALVGMLAAAASLLLRLRRAVGEERRQLKWLAYIGGLLAVLFVLQALAYHILNFATPEFNLVFRVTYSVTLVALPIFTGLAILRYRLFDIDILIRRTLIYGALTSGLGLVYWISVAVLQQVLRHLTEGSELAIIGSTLSVAFLFQPVRRRIQSVVDQRFYRRKYNAIRELEAFGATLQQEIDLNTLSAELLGVVQRTVQPTRVSIWLRAKVERAQ